MDSLWNIHLFGGLRAVRGDIEVSRFPLRKVAALLAYLACLPSRDHPRELLIELLWPESDLDAGRNRFSVTLSSLRRMLEPPAGDPGGPVRAGTVLHSDRFVVRLNADAVVTDVGEFQNRIRRSELTSNAAEELQCLRSGIERYQGPLLPGYYDEWALIERDRQAETYVKALERLTQILDRQGDSEEALEYARAAVRLEPSREEAHRCLIRAYARLEQVPKALRQYLSWSASCGRNSIRRRRSLRRSSSTRSAAARSPSPPRNLSAGPRRSSFRRLLSRLRAGKSSWGRQRQIHRIPLTPPKRLPSSSRLVPQGLIRTAHGRGYHSRSPGSSDVRRSAITSSASSAPTSDW